MKFRLTLMTIAAASALSFAAGQAQAADVSATIVIKCAPTGPAVAACVAGGFALHELVQLGNGKQAFGPNGEGMKFLHGIGSLFSNGSDPKDGLAPMRSRRLRD